MQTTNLLTFFFWAIDWFATNVSIIKSIELVLPLDTQKLFEDVYNDKLLYVH